MLLRSLASAILSAVNPLRLKLGSDAGSVTAEFAVTLPAVVAVFALCLGGVAAGQSQLRLQDAAADSARALGRGESVDVSSAIANRISGGAELSVSREGDVVCAHLTKTLSAPFSFVLSASACAFAGGL